MMQTVTLAGPGVLHGNFVPPGDKSISHRAVMFGALASGESSYTHFLEAEDCLHTVKAFQMLGVSIDLPPGSGRIKIQGVGLAGLEAPSKEIYLGNSGTSMRLLLGILAGQRFEATLTGDASLAARPMKRVTAPLKQMGAQIKGRDNGNFAPLTIRGGKLKGIRFENNLASAQVKSALLLAGLYAEGRTEIIEPLASRDHTERFLAYAGARFLKDGTRLFIEKTDQLKPLSAEIPGDISSAAFFITAAAMTPGSMLTVEKVNLNPTRTGLLHALKRMGADLKIDVTHEEPEPLGVLRVSGRRLKGTRVTKEEIPSLVDELPVLMTAMCLAEGESIVSGAGELRVKETDRIRSMVENLSALGADIRELPDGCVIAGVKALRGGKVKSFGDHRTAMSLAIASLASPEDVLIEDTECIATSFPAFFPELERLRKKG